jgi:hypothetical protein
MSLTKVTYSMIDGNIVNVKDFGASTSDTVGTTNRAAIQAAINTNKSVRFDELYTVDGPLLVNTRQRLFSEKSWRENSGAGLNFKFNSTADVNCISGIDTVTRSLNGCVFDGLQLRIDRGCVFSDTITVNMISASGRFLQLLNCWSQNLAFSQIQLITNITSSGTTATVTKANHGLTNGDLIRMVGVSIPEIGGDQFYNGIFTVVNVATNTFDYVMTGTPTTASPNITVYKSGYFPKRDFSSGVTGTNINFSYFLYLDSLKTGYPDNGLVDSYNGTFESFVTGCTTSNFYGDVYLQGRSPTPGEIGLIVAPIFYGNQFNSINPDYGNFSGNIQGSNISNLIITNNILGSLANNILVAGDSQNVGVTNNYYEGGNSGTRRVTIGNNTIRTLITEYSISSNNGSIFDNSTAGTYTALTFNGMQLNGGTFLDRYEEGTWTPAYAPTTGAFTTVTYFRQSGKYVVIGNMVTVQCLMSTDVVTLGTAGGNLKVAGLPFIMDYASGLGIANAVAPCRATGYASASVQPNQVNLESNTQFVIPQIVNSGAVPTNIVAGNLLAGTNANSNTISFTMTYKIYTA